MAHNEPLIPLARPSAARGTAVAFAVKGEEHVQ
jgi:hypothetical protein